MYCYYIIINNMLYAIYKSIHVETCKIFVTITSLEDVDAECVEYNGVRFELTVQVSKEDESEVVDISLLPDTG